MSALIAVEEAGDQLNQDELPMTIVLLFSAGFETTANLLATADKHEQGQGALALFLRTLSWPRWSVTSGSSAARDFIAMDLRPVLLIVFVAALIC